MADFNCTRCSASFDNWTEWVAHMQTCNRVAGFCQGK